MAQHPARPPEAGLPQQALVILILATPPTPACVWGWPAAAAVLEPSCRTTLRSTCSCGSRSGSSFSANILLFHEWRRRQCVIQDLHSRAVFFTHRNCCLKAALLMYKVRTPLPYNHQTNHPHNTSCTSLCQKCWQAAAV